MKYRITIDEISPKKVIKSVYFPEKINNKGEEGVWADTEVIEEVSSEIYDQTIDKDIDLKSIIDAFNK